MAGSKRSSRRRTSVYMKWDMGENTPNSPARTMGKKAATAPHTPVRANKGGFDANDDDRERQQLRTQQFGSPVVKPHETRSPLQPKVVNDRRTSLHRKSLMIGKKVVPRRTVNDEQLADMYSQAIELNNKKKINQKNSWSLNLIDHISDMVSRPSTKTKKGVANFQLASCTLDASVTIYSCRVDSVHSTTYKMLGGLSRTKGGVEGDDGFDSDGEDDGTGRIKRQRKARASTLAADVESINVKHFDLGFAVDPLFHKTSAKFDEGGARGLLLNNLSVYHGCDLVFDSNDNIEGDRHTAAADAGADAELESAECDVGMFDALAAATRERIQDMHVCEVMCQFKESRRDMLHGVYAAAAASDTAAVEAASAAADAEEEAGEENLLPDDMDSDSDADDDMGAPMGDFDMPDGGDSSFLMGDDAAVPPANHDPAAAGVGAVSPRKTRSRLETAVREGAQGNDAQWFDPKMLTKMSWAGPDHWKFRSGGADDADKSTAAKKKKAKAKAKRVKLVIDFTQDVDEGKLELTKRGNNTLTAASLEKNEGANTLPVDVHYDINQLTMLFTKPKTSVVMNQKARAAAAAAQGDDDDDEDNDMGDFYDYDNANDHANFVPDDEFGAPEIHVDDNEEAHGGVPGSALESLGIDMVEKPTMVSKLEIKYAKKQKKVNVKALKVNLWGCLCAEEEAKKKKKKHTHTDAREADAEAEAAAEDAAPHMGGTEEKKFSELLHELPGVVPRKEMESVSVPLAFICLLHLANEKGLAIKDNGNLNDLVVTQPLEPEPILER